MKVLVAFDLEGTLINEEFLVELARAVGKEQEVAKITHDGIQGKIDWTTGLKKRIEILKGIPQAKIEKMANDYTIAKGVREIFTSLQGNGFETAIITGGFKIMADKVAKELGVTNIMANEFIFKDGKLDGVKINVRANKDELLKKLIADTNADYSIAMSDGITDLNMLDAADCGMLIKDHAFKGFKMVLGGLSQGLKEKGTML